MSLHVFVISFFLGATCQSIEHSIYLKERILCDVNDRINRRCSNKLGKVRSRVQCLTQCGRDTSCIGASLDENGSCFHHKECPFVPECTREDNGHHYMTKYCAHGTWDPADQSCKCVDGFYGDRCKQCHGTCADLISAGYEAGNHWVYLDPGEHGKRPFLIQCGISQTGWYGAYLLNQEGSHDFNKTWNDYVYGFRYDNNNYWTGLYAWHRMSTAGYNTLVFGFWFLSRLDTVMYREYYNVFVSDETNTFTLNFTGTSGASGRKRGDVPSGSYFGDCLGQLRHIPFSTWDVNNNPQNASENCAARSGSGWWYDGCDNPCNALGFGPQYLSTMPRDQVMSLLGLDMSLVSSENVAFIIYII